MKPLPQNLSERLARIDRELQRRATGRHSTKFLSRLERANAALKKAEKIGRQNFQIVH